MSNLLPQPSMASATGNPRNKTALKPGHSLMDWIRLRGDLAGTKGVVTPVTMSELRKHNKRKDAWMAIRGKVYNVTRYMDFHPGGVDELMKGVGMDATKVFDEVHAWVNYDQMLSKCYVGPLRMEHESPFPFMAPGNNKSKIPSSHSSSLLDPGMGVASAFRLPFSSSASNFLSPSDQNASAKEKAEEPPKQPQPTEVAPRFDWIQKTAEVVVIFYTRPFCNPAAMLDFQGGGQVEVKLVVDSSTYLVKFAFMENVNWPPRSIRNVIETGKVEITFEKEVPNLWAIYGEMELTKVTELDARLYEYNVDGCWPINHDSYALLLRPQGTHLMHFSVGHHASITSDVEGVEVTRSYTAIPNSFLGHPGDLTCVSLLIKSYEHGTMSRHICQPNQLVQGLKLSLPKGAFPIAQLLKSCARAAFFAAGSGLTPFLGAVQYLIDNKQSNKGLESVKLFVFNKTEADIWCREKLDAVGQLLDKKFEVTYILSDADGTWPGARGRVSKGLIESVANPSAESPVTFIGVCGPPAFNSQVAEFTASVGFPASSLHIFRG